MTPTRRLIRQRMLTLSRRLGSQARVLEIGIAGDDPPGANREFFHAAQYVTADKNPALTPDLVLDLEGGARDHWDVACLPFDLVICSQTLEHVWNLEAAFQCLYGLTAWGGYCIADTPFNYPPHGTETEPDYWRLTPQALERLATKAGFDVVEIVAPDHLLVSALLRKGQKSESV